MIPKSLRPALFKDMCSKIEATNFFLPNDFSYEETKFSNSQAGIVVKYLASPNLWFSFSLPTAYTTSKDGYSSKLVVHTISSPGELGPTQTDTVDGWEGLVVNFALWLRRAEVDLKDGALARELAKQREVIEDIVADVASKAESSEVFFTRQEIRRCSQRLDELEQKLADEISKHATSKESKEKVKEDIDLLKKEIDSLKKQLATLSKVQWLRGALARLLKWFSKQENRELVADATSVAQHLLGPGNAD
ncbi:hypothetical protein KEG38_08580 [Polyangium jinanense]|uniref:hypothetical protein n=1 Tax=Polyangium jinanense TaxID=2829994 RepID=UPI0023408F50|nr:hypothetical protein [Polyangium jinanense]MDC3953898.1 hypothetical protein [Polyangium jinanense]